MAFPAWAPVFRTADMARSVRFYVDVLGFKSESRVQGSTNLYRDAVRIILSVPDPKEEWKAPCFTGHLYIGVDTIGALEELWAKAKDRAEIVFAPKDLAYDAREFFIRDPDGYGLLFGALSPRK